jgi:uncharacterized membrane protein YbhN (UPF0104 family)
MWLVTETLRWLPGGALGVVSRAVQARDAGIAALPASLAAALEVLMLVVAWGATAIGTLALSGVGESLAAGLPKFWLVVSAASLVSTVALAFALARYRPSATIAKKIRGLAASLRHIEEARPEWRWLLVTFAFMVALCFLQGAAFMAVLRATSDATPTFLAAACVNAAGWLVGFFAFFAPTGIGVREGGMAAMLAPLMPVDAAIVAVLLWRVVQVGVELLCLAGCYVPRVASALSRLASRAPNET